MSFGVEVGTVIDSVFTGLDGLGDASEESDLEDLPCLRVLIVRDAGSTSVGRCPPRPRRGPRLPSVPEQRCLRQTTDRSSFSHTSSANMV